MHGRIARRLEDALRSSRAIRSLARWVPPWHAPSSVTPPVRTFATTARSQAGEERTMRVLSLNVAHGRESLPHQLLQSSAHRERTLARIAELFARTQPHVVGLQEADGPSFWSGGFCHVDRLAQLGGFAFAAHGTHVHSRLLRYGTGLLSAHALESAVAITFDPSHPTPAKGFTVGAAQLDDGRSIDVASVHLDFARTRVRARQVARTIEVLAERRSARPLILMGDFNAGWNDSDSAVRILAEALDLVAHAPEAPARATGIHTFPRTRARLDWILVSRELAFERYEVLPDVVSDHRPVLAHVRIPPAR